MKLSGKKDPVADISGKSLRDDHSIRDTDGAIFSGDLFTLVSVRVSVKENLSGL
jgi:hypothetical protein